MIREHAHNRIFLFVRHAEATKNVLDIQGGSGTHLTLNGRKQAIIAARVIREAFHLSKKPLVFCPKVPQGLETAIIVGRYLKIRPRFDERLRGKHIGVLAGLSRSEALLRYPKAAQRLEKFRAGEIAGNQTRTPGAEPLKLFMSRVKSLLSDWIDRKNNDLIVGVCSRSILIMLANLVELGDSFSFGRYKFYDFTPCSFTRIDLVERKLKLVWINGDPEVIRRQLRTDQEGIDRKQK
jgi:broad specificity phosphatase PhoE